MWRVPEVVAGLTVALALAGISGCGRGGSAAGVSGPVELQYEQIDLLPGGTKEVKVLAGKVAAAKAPQRSGLTAESKGDTLLVCAAQNARLGKHTVTITGDNARETSLAVLIRAVGARRGRSY